MKKYLVALGLLLSSTLPSFSSDVVIGDFDPGGSIGTYMMYYERWYKSGNKLVIDGTCISACTIFLRYVGEQETNRVCITSRGLLGFHQASNGENSDPILTQAMVRLMYPQWVQEWIKSKGGLKPEVTFMSPEEMKGHIPLCDGESYPTVPLENLIAKPEQPQIDIKTIERGKSE
jgi:hypothetical protein